MHKLIVIAFGVWKNKLKYDDQFETNRQNILSKPMTAWTAHVQSASAPFVRRAHTMWNTCKTMLSRPNAVSRVAVVLTAGCRCYA